jgi:hypothetical protein
MATTLAYQEEQAAKRMENPTTRGPIAPAAQPTAEPTPTATAAGEGGAFDWLRCCYYSQR